MPALRFPLTSYLPIENASIKGIDAILKRAARDLERDILKAAGDSVSAEVNRAQLEAQLKAIKTHLKGDWRDIAAAITRGQAAAVAAAERVLAEYQWPLFKSLVDRATFDAVVNNEALRAASGVRTLMDRLGGSYLPLSKQVYKTEALVNGWVDNSVNSALARGLTAREFAREVRQFIDPAVPGGASYAARRLARTEINNAYHVGTLRRYADSGVVEEVDWNLSSSHPEGDECDDYKAQSPWPVDNVPKKPHPQCLCFLTPALPEPDEFLAKMLAGLEYSEEYAGPPRAAALGVLERAAAKAGQSLRSYANYASTTTLRVNAGKPLANIYQSNLARGVYTELARRRPLAIAAGRPDPISTARIFRRGPGGTTLVSSTRIPRSDLPPKPMLAIRDIDAIPPKPTLLELETAREIAEPIRDTRAYAMATNPRSVRNQNMGIRNIDLDEAPGSGAINRDFVSLRDLINNIPEGTDESFRYSDKMVQTFSDIFGREEFAGLKIKVDFATARTGGTGAYVNFSGKIIDPITSKQVGSIERIFRMDGDNLVVKHEFLKLDKEYQGKGFSTQLDAFQRDLYAKSGGATIKVHAALDKGAYTWAKAGYDWDPDYYGVKKLQDYPEYIVLGIRTRLEESKKRAARGEVPYFEPDVEAYLDDMVLTFMSEPIEKWPKPIDLVNSPMIGKDWTGVEVPIGKLIFNGQVDWRGKRVVRPNADAPKSKLPDYLKNNTAPAPAPAVPTPVVKPPVIPETPPIVRFDTDRSKSQEVELFNNLFEQGTSLDGVASVPLSEQDYGRIILTSAQAQQRGTQELYNQTQSLLMNSGPNPRTIVSLPVMSTIESPLNMIGDEVNYSRTGIAERVFNNNPLPVSDGGLTMSIILPDGWRGGVLVDGSSMVILPANYTVRILDVEKVGDGYRGRGILVAQEYLPI